MWAGEKQLHILYRSAASSIDHEVLSSIGSFCTQNNLPFLLTVYLVFHVMFIDKEEEAIIMHCTIRKVHGYAVLKTARETLRIERGDIDQDEINELLQSQRQLLDQELSQADTLPRSLAYHPSDLTRIPHQYYELTPQTNTLTKQMLVALKLVEEDWGGIFRYDSLPISHVVTDCLSAWDERQDYIFDENPGFKGKIVKLFGFVQFERGYIYSISVIAVPETAPYTFIFALYVDKDYTETGYTRRDIDLNVSHADDLIKATSKTLRDLKVTCKLTLHHCLNKVVGSKTYRTKLRNNGWNVVMIGTDPAVSFTP